MKQQYFLNIDYNSETELNFNISSNIDFNELKISTGYILQSNDFNENNIPIFISCDFLDNQIIGSICDSYDYGTYNYSKNLNVSTPYIFYYKNLFNLNQNIKLYFKNISNTPITNIVGKIYILFEFYKYGAGAEST